MPPENQPVFIRLTIRDTESNEVFLSNENEASQPLEVVPGQGQIFPKVEELLPSMAVGERKSVVLPKEDAFGEVVDEAVQKVPLENLPEELREAGTKLSAQTDNAQTVQGTVISIEDDTAIVDFNHPLAGKEVEVEFVVVEKP